MREREGQSILRNFTEGFGATENLAIHRRLVLKMEASLRSIYHSKAIWSLMLSSELLEGQSRKLIGYIWIVSNYTKDRAIEMHKEKLLTV